MKHEFVPYEQALEHKELGFNEPCFMQWTYEPKLIPCICDWGKLTPKTNQESYYDSIGTCISAPTFSQAFRWFREKYELVVDWNHGQHDNFGSYIGVCIKNIHFEETIVGVYKTYEKAELACLIKLIQIVKEKK